MLKNLKLAQKGILLVCIPLLFEILFVALLAVLLQQADKAARDEARCRAIVAQTNALTMSMFDVATTLVAYRYTRSSIFFKRYREAVSQIPDIFKDLRQLTAGNASQEDHVKRLQQLQVRIEYLTKNFSHPDESAGLLFANPHEYKEAIETTYDSFMQEGRQLVQEAKVVESVNPQTAEQSKQRVLWWLVAGVIFNVVVALSLARLYGRTITERLSVLVDNNLRMKERKPLNALVSGNDEISELDRAFHDMAGALQQAEQRKQEYVMMVTHDLRTPLNSVAGCIELLANGSCGPLGAQAENTTDRAEQQLNRVLNMINEWLDVERLQSAVSQVSCTRLVLAGIFKQLAREVHSLAQRAEVEIVVEETQPPDLTTYADEDLIGRLLTNLVGNALKFAPQGSQVTLRARSDQEGVRVEVCDQGRGVPAHLKEQIFERFSQVEKSDATVRGGTGLGLAICKALVETHKGKIGVESEEGKGSTFWFWLPGAPPS